jgi:hypothetical protein
MGRILLVVTMVALAAACQEGSPGPVATTTTPTVEAPRGLATCSEFDSQAEAQSAADAGDVRFRDPDGDGRYCEDLP